MRYARGQAQELAVLSTSGTMAGMKPIATCLCLAIAIVSCAGHATQPEPWPQPEPSSPTGDLAQSASTGASGVFAWLPAAELDAFGVDQDGWFHAPDDQDVAPAYVLRLLNDLDEAEGVLRRGELLSFKSLDEKHTMFKAEMRLATEDAELLGVEVIPVAVKPRAESYYGREYKRELAFYTLARYLEAESGLVPIVERFIAPWSPFEANLKEQLSRKQFRRLKNKLIDVEEEPWMYGSVQLWATGYQNIVGHNETSGNRLRTWARTLRPGRRDVEGDPIWQALSDMYVLDFLSYNYDRARELGSVRLPDGGQRLIVLDNGDAFYSDDPDENAPETRELFESVERFSPNVLEKLESLDKKTIRDLFRTEVDSFLVGKAHRKRLLRRAEQAVAHMRAVGEKHNSKSLRRVLFAQPSPSSLEAAGRPFRKRALSGEK